MNVSVKDVWLAASGRVYNVISLNGICIERKGGSGALGVAMQQSIKQSVTTILWVFAPDSASAVVHSLRT